MNIIRIIMIALLPKLVFAGIPLLSITPTTPTVLQIPALSTFTVSYVVKNQSNKAHTWVMKPIAGVSQLTTISNCPTPFRLGPQQSCTLVLAINGGQVSNFNSDVEICQQGTNGQPNPLLCYRTSYANRLQISTLPIKQIMYSGAQNGNVYFSYNSGSTWGATTVPANGSPINSIFAANNGLYAAAANGFIYYSGNNGLSWNQTTTPDGSSIKVVFATSNTLYAGTASGFVYFSSNNGISWNRMESPDGSAVNALFVSGASLYAGTEDGLVYYSADNGENWTILNGTPDGTAIQGIYVAKNALFVNTASEYAYSTTALTGGGIWTAFAQSVFSLFVSSTGSYYGGTQGGYVYSISNGSELGFVVYSLLNSIYILG